jgi:hypothetical protein
MQPVLPATVEPRPPEHQQLVAIGRAPAAPGEDGDSPQLALAEITAAPKGSTNLEASPETTALAPLARSSAGGSADRCAAAPLQLSLALANAGREVRVGTKLPQGICRQLPATDRCAAAPFQLALVDSGREVARADEADRTSTEGKENAQASQASAETLVPQAWSRAGSAMGAGTMGRASSGAAPLQLSLANGGEGERCASLPLVVLK